MTTRQAAPESQGLYSITGEEAAVLDEVDAAVLEWARARAAGTERHSELLTVEQLDRIGYFDSFPHLAHRVTPWLREGAKGGELVLTSAACYGVYFARAGSAVADHTLVTVRQSCRRQEKHYQARRRQREFQMREVVALGTAASVEAFLIEGAAFVRALARQFGVDGDFAVATDPFFRKDDPRLIHQRLFPTKQEFIDTSELAIASVNAHRNFFGERCAIRLASQTPAFSGCVAFGLERWVDAVIRAGRSVGHSPAHRGEPQ